MAKNPQKNIDTFAIVDDHKAVADIVGYALQTKLPVCCVGIFYSAEEARSKLPTLAPKVVITDWRLGQESSQGLLKGLRDQMPNTKWLLFTAWPTSAVLREMLSAGIHGCVSKSSDYNELSVAMDKLLKRR